MGTGEGGTFATREYAGDERKREREREKERGGEREGEREKEKDKDERVGPTALPRGS